MSRPEYWRAKDFDEGWEIIPTFDDHPQPESLRELMVFLERLDAPEEVLGRAAAMTLNLAARVQERNRAISHSNLRESLGSGLRGARDALHKHKTEQKQRKQEHRKKSVNEGQRDGLQDVHRRRRKS